MTIREMAETITKIAECMDYYEFQDLLDTEEITREELTERTITDIENGDGYFYTEFLEDNADKLEDSEYAEIAKKIISELNDISK